MPKKQSNGNKRHPLRRDRSVTNTFRDVTVDEVINDLLFLFKQLGLDASRFIKKARNADLPKNAPRHYPHLSTIGDLLTLWYRDPRYINESGDPVAIKMRGAIRSFCDLADRAAPNISAKQLLMELQRLHAVAIDSKGFIRARTRTLPAYQDERFAIAHTLNSLRDFIKTLSHNLKSKPSNSDQLFHRIAWNGELALNEVPRLKIWLKRHGQSLLESTDNWMVGRTRNPGATTKGAKRAAQVSVGIYLAVEKI